MKNDLESVDFLSKNKVHKSLNPRDVLCGGRTNAFVWHQEGKIGYVDFTSLYLYIQRYGSFPIGHPEIITENFEYFGLINCSILPPNNLYIRFDKEKIKTNSGLKTLSKLLLNSQCYEYR